MMQIIEIPVILDSSTDAAALFSTLGQSEIREYEGMDFASLTLDDGHRIYFYFLDQSKQQYHYLWDLVIPHAPSCLLICDWTNIEIFEANIRALEFLEKRFATPVYACVLGVQQAIPDSIKDSGLSLGTHRRLRFLNTSDKESAKKVLAEIFESI